MDIKVTEFKVRGFKVTLEKAVSIEDVPALAATIDALYAASDPVTRALLLAEAAQK